MDSVLVDRPVVYFENMTKACLTEVCLSFNYIQVSAYDVFPYINTKRFIVNHLPYT